VPGFEAGQFVAVRRSPVEGVVVGTAGGLVRVYVELRGGPAERDMIWSLPAADVAPLAGPPCDPADVDRVLDEGEALAFTRRAFACAAA
jgi:hypothetical protein